MREDHLRKLLLSRAFTPDPARPEKIRDQGSGQISRRKFLTGSATGGSMALMVGSEPGQPQVVNLGRMIVVSYLGSTWEIDPALFGSAAEAVWGRDRTGFEIELSRATLPGTDLAVSFSARLWEESGVWKVSFSMPGIGFTASDSLATWISGTIALRSISSVRQIRLGEGSVSICGEDLRVTVNPSFMLEFGGPSGGIRLTHPAHCTGEQLLLKPQPSRTEFLGSAFDPDQTGPATFFSIAEPYTGRAIILNSATKSRTIAFSPGNVTACCGEAFDSAAGRESITLLEGAGAVELDVGTRGLRNSGVVRLEHAALLLSTGGRESNAALAGRLSRSKHDLDLGSCVATVSGNDNSPIYARFRGGQTDPIRVRGELHGFGLPVRDADVAHFAVPRQSVDILLPVASGGPKAGGLQKSLAVQKESGGALIVLGKEPIVVASLDGAKLNIRRAIDLFNLSFSFEGFDLRVRQGIPILQRRRLKKKDPNWEGATVTVHFPPQHVAEQWFDVQDPNACKTPPPFPEVSRARLSGPSRVVFTVPDDAHRTLCLKTDAPPRTRGAVVWKERPITIDALTDWSELALNVKDRALPPEASFDAQMRLVHIETSSSVEDVLKNIAATMQPPAVTETSLEMTGRLILSPSCDAKWLVPRGKVDPRNAVLWHARLDERGRKTVRAIWSELMVPGRIYSPERKREQDKLRAQTTLLAPISNASTNIQVTSTSGFQSPTLIVIDNEIIAVATRNRTAFTVLSGGRAKDGTTAAPHAPGALVSPRKDLLVLDAYDHWQIMAQTSVYGLIALRRLNDPKAKAVDATDKAFKNLPRSQVIRPESEYKSLIWMDQKRKYTEHDSGFAIPAPFNDASIILTSVGGTLDADWLGEPPLLLDDRIDGNPNPLKVEWPSPFDLERFGYRSQLGRDIRIDIERKGYLLPLGIRASYVELTERRFFRHPLYRYPVAQLVRRTFIVIHKPEKPMPGVHQPFESRDFPAERILMLTRSTPDLVNPRSDAPICANSEPGNGGVGVRENGRLVVDGLPDTAIAFWPRVTNGCPSHPGGVDFRWTLDNDDSPIVSNLLFVSNQCLAYESSLRRIVEYYRGLGKTDHSLLSLRTAQVFGARRRYAPTEKEGETSFDTASWLLSTRGRILPGGANSEAEAFQMDGRMEGADQPPFYPVMEKAQVTIQSLDRLTGRPQGLIDVQFNSTYVRTGFSQSENKSEIFLNVLGPDIKLDVTDQGSASGGFAKPNTLVAALSRKTGLIGGVKKDSGPAPDPSGITPTNIVALWEGHPSTPSTSINVLDTRRPDEPAPPATPELNSPYNFKGAQEGSFDPAQFFGGVENAKLLGLIPLKDLVKTVSIEQAPKLLEKVGYGALGSAADTALAAIKNITITILPPLLQEMDDLRNGFNAYLAKRLPDPSKRVAFGDLYPSLNARLDALNKSLAAAIPEIKGATTLVAIGSVVTTIATEARSLLSEVERTLRNPVPTLVQGEIDELANIWNSLKSLISGDYRNLGQKLYSQMAGGAFAMFCKKVEEKHLGVLLFGVGSTVTCEAIVAEPAIAFNSVKNALFSQVFGEPLAIALVYLRNLGSQVFESVLWTRQSLETLVASKIDKAVDGLRDRLVPPTQGDVANILSERIDAGSARVTLTNAILTSVSARVAIPIYKANLGADFEMVKRTLVETEQAIGGSGIELRAVITKYRAYFKVINPSQSDAVIQEFIDQTVQPIVEEATAAVRAETARMEAMFLSRQQETRAGELQHLFGAVERILNAMDSAALFATVAEEGRKIADWCDSPSRPQHAKVVAFVDDMAGGILGVPSNIAYNVSRIAQRAQELKVPQGAPVDVINQLDLASGALKRGAQQLATTLQTLNVVRSSLGDFRRQVDLGHKRNVCEDVAVFLEPVSRLMQLRREAVDRLQDLASQVVAAQAIVDQGTVLINLANAGQLSLDKKRQVDVLSKSLTNLSTSIGDIVKALAALMSDVTSIGRAGAGDTIWKGLKTQIAVLRKSNLTSIPAYVNKLSSEVQALEEVAVEIRTSLHAPSLNPKALRNLAARVATYSMENEKRVAALALQSCALIRDLSLALGNFAAAGLAETAKLFVSLHEAGSNLLSKLVERLDRDPVMALVLNQETVKSFRDAKSQVDLDLTYLRKVANAGNNVGEVRDATLKLLNDRWRTDPPQPPALLRALTVLGDLVEHLLRGDLGSLINDSAVKQIMASLEGRLKALVQQLVPTRTDLSYSWATKLASAGPFSMTDPDAADHLSIRSNVTVDFLTGARSAFVEGKLKPFTLTIFNKSDLDFATIKFKEAHFASTDGSSPEFSAQVEDVQLGSRLKFLQALQAWMSPNNDSGVYVRASLFGVEAGYNFDAGVIQVGTLQFINVSLGIFAQLPFGNSPAKLGFSFGSAARPFLISSPPYGGGGYAILVADCQGVDISLSFTFGAVVAIKFGPLNAQGRVTAGIYIGGTGDRRKIGAIVEAVGEGNIACFGICVALQVALISDGGHLYGEARYSFTFKVGFLSFSFSFKVSYTIHGEEGSSTGGGPLALNFPPSNRNGGARNALYLTDAGADGPPRAFAVQDAPAKPPAEYDSRVDPHNSRARRVTNKAPRKAVSWPAYQRRMSMGLLRD